MLNLLLYMKEWGKGGKDPFGGGNTPYLDN